MGAHGSLEPPTTHAVGPNHPYHLTALLLSYRDAPPNTDPPMMEEEMPGTTRKTAAPVKRAAAKRAPAKVEPTVEVEVEEIEETEDEPTETREQYELLNKGRTKQGAGKELYFNLHERGVRGQVFVPLNATAVKVLIVFGTEDAE